VHPIAYSAAYEANDRNRLTVFFRLLLVIPWLFVAMFWGFAAYIAVFIAWFALLFTGRYPQGLYDFNAGFLRFITRTNGFCWLLTDEFPPFNGAEDSTYPIKVLIEPPKEEYSRAKVFFRIILLIPVAILGYVMSIIQQVVGIVAWFVILFTGELSQGLYKPLRIATAYQAKALGYYMLLSEDFPPFWMDEEEEAPRFLGPGGGAGTPGLENTVAQPAGPFGT
jgi:hypothetical protein